MKVSITGRKFNLKENFRDHAEKRLEKIERFFGDDAEAKVTVTVEKDRQTVEVTIRNGGMLYRTECTAPKMEDALDRTVDDIIRKIRKNKTKVEKRLRSGSLDAMVVPLEELSDEEEFKIVKIKRFPIKPMDVEEAVLEMNMIGHQFYMFRDMQTGEIHVVYRRRDGNYGLIAPDND